eukprot:14588785-Ditylum_brightwellii.AAC.1
MQWMKGSHTQDKHYILAGNSNETIHSTSGMIKFCSNDKLQLGCILGDMTETKHITTRTGQERIDHILMSPKLVTLVCKKGYQSFDQMNFTDHRGMFLDLDTISVFGADMVNLIRNNCCDTRTTDPHCVTKYITIAHTHLMD